MILDRWRDLRQGFSTRLWPLPVLGLVVAFGLGIATPQLDAAVDELPPWLEQFFFSGGASAARTVLGAIATSLISVTSLTFSLTVVTLQLASSQYSPRLLRTFSSDRFVHGTLTLFLASFVYSLTVLRTVRAPDESRSAFVPEISVTVAYLLALASVLGLVLFLAHLTREIRVETILRNVHREARATAARMLRPASPDQAAVDAAWPRSGGSRLLLAPTSGFLTVVDRSRLVATAAAVDVLVDLEVVVGSSVVEGTPIGLVRTTPDVHPSPHVSDDLDRQLTAALTFGYERTASEDVGFGLRQLTDVATKALSPGVNDPTTAVHALNHGAALLCTLSGYDLSTDVLLDEEGSPRVRLRQPSFPDLLDVTLAQPRHYGIKDGAVVAALFGVLESVGWAVDLPEHRAAVDAELARLRAALAAEDVDQRTSQGHAALAERAEAALRRPREALGVVATAP